MPVPSLAKIFVSRHNQRIDTALRSLRALRETWLTTQRPFTDAAINGMVAADVKTFKEAQTAARHALSSLSQHGFSSTSQPFQTWYARFGKEALSIATDFAIPDSYGSPKARAALPFVQLNLATLLDPAYTPHPSELNNHLLGLPAPPSPPSLLLRPPRPAISTVASSSKLDDVRPIPEWLPGLSSVSTSVEIKPTTPARSLSM